MATSEPPARIRRATSSPEMSGRPTSRMITSTPGGRLGDLEAVQPGRGRLHDVAVLLEQAAQEADEPRVVLDDEQVHGNQPTLHCGSIVTLPAVPIGPDAAALACGWPFPPASSWTSTFDPALTSAAVAGVLLA